VSDQLFPDADAHVIDTDLFIAFERNGAVNLLERSTSEHNVTLLVPQRVYDELAPENLPYDTPPVDSAIEAGWVRVLDEVDYANPVVSSTMDMVNDTFPPPTSGPNTRSNRPTPKSGVRLRRSSNEKRLNR